MNGFFRGALWVVLLIIVFPGCGSGGSSNPPGAPVPTVVVQPLPLPGPYSVGCSNIIQDFSRVGPGESATDYWEGAATATGLPRYVTDLLAGAGNTLIANVNAPNDPDLYGSFAGQTVSFVVLACYPTTHGNPRPAYPFRKNLGEAGWGGLSRYFHLRGKLSDNVRPKTPSQLFRADREVLARADPRRHEVAQSLVLECLD